MPAMCALWVGELQIAPLRFEFTQPTNGRALTASFEVSITAVQQKRDAELGHSEVVFLGVIICSLPAKNIVSKIEIAGGATKLYSSFLYQRHLVITLDNLITGQLINIQVEYCLSTNHKKRTYTIPPFARKLRSFGHRFILQNFRPPCASEIAEQFELPIERVIEILTETGSPCCSEDTLQGALPRLITPTSSPSFNQKKIVQLLQNRSSTPDIELEEIAHDFNIAKERIRPIEAAALRKLRPPSRSKRLKKFLEE